MEDLVSKLNDWATWLLVFALPGAGIFFTVVTRGVQFRHLGDMGRIIFSSRGNAKDGGISSFQAFSISLASRVGTGNIVGVALALILGGPGAVFWMWVMAFLGMATAFVEATLAQLYKVPHSDGTFRGGPAYYIQRGLKSRGAGIVFAVALIFTFGLAFNQVQANTIAGVMESTFDVDPLIVGIVLATVTAATLYGGIKRVAKVAEIMAPTMAIVYVLFAAAVLVTGFADIPDAIMMIIRSALGFDQALAGLEGAFLAALLNGVKRGMFSNEAGMGSAPNAAATASASHPAHQGFIQSAGVFVDTIIVCTATAVMILLAGPSIYSPGETQKDASATLTQNALSAELGTWVEPVFAIMIFVFCYSSILGNYTYAEVNQDFIGGGHLGNHAIRLLVVGASFWGAVQSLSTVWGLADVAMAVMAVINLVAIMMLGRSAVGTLKDYESQPTLAPMDRVFDLADNPFVPDDIPGDVWHSSQARDVQGSPHN